MRKKKRKEKKRKKKKHFILKPNNFGRIDEFVNIEQLTKKKILLLRFD